MSPKVEVQKNKLLVKWGVQSNSSSEKAQVQGRKMRSMSSHSGEIKSESAAVKSSEKAPEKRERILCVNFCR